jgi:hypothetical protein
VAKERACVSDSKVSYSDIAKRLSEVSDRLSSQVRTLSLGVLAFTWGLFVGESDVSRGFTHAFRSRILAIGALAITALLFDFLQYVFGYWDSYRLIRSLDQVGADEGMWDSGSFLYRAQAFCFGAKQVVLLAATLWLLFDIGIYLLAGNRA